MARNVGEGNAQGFLGAASILGDQSSRGLLEKREHGVVDLLEVGADVHGAGLDHVLGLRHTDALQLDTSLVLDLLNEHLRLAGVERDARSAGASSGGTTGPMDVGLCLLRGLNLDDQVDVGDVEASGSDISGDQDSEFALLEALHGHLTLVLGDVTVHDLDILLDLVREQEGVGVGLRLGKDNDLATLAVDNKNVSESRQSVLVGALDGQMGHVTSRLVLELLGEIHDAHARLHVSGGDVSHPSGDGGREEKDLQVLTTLSSACREDLKLWKDDGLEGSEMNLKWVMSKKSLTLSTSSLKPCLSI